MQRTPDEATPAPRAATTLVLLSRSLSASRQGRVTLKLRNPNASPARGQVTLASGRTILGHAGFSSPAGRATSVGLRLSSAGRRLLARKRTLRVTVKVATPAGTTTRTLTLRAAR
jgi:hypothetical protein